MPGSLPQVVRSPEHRLYRIGIGKYLLEIKSDFLIFGLKDDEWVKFDERHGI